ncbi:hypothetical protein MSG28_007391 [Choristoneura fumiferana]|uniref:Uncharacterized protein n=1 Tax=Choristoneura fumiferana TaxID=7141 RepID=A0ACC0JWR9_CHOFU|nr:hypothetical protein MSG28_007391 [Choristoneura fumiferana]
MRGKKRIEIYIAAPAVAGGGPRRLESPSEFLNRSLYFCDWLSLSPRLRRLLLVMMVRCSRAVAPRTAYIIPMSLETYIAQHSRCENILENLPSLRATVQLRSATPRSKLQDFTDALHMDFPPKVVTFTARHCDSVPSSFSNAKSAAGGRLLARLTHADSGRQSLRPASSVLRTTAWNFVYKYVVVGAGRRRTARQLARGSAAQACARADDIHGRGRRRASPAPRAAPRHSAQRLLANELGVVSMNCDHKSRAERAKRACRGSGRRSARTDMVAFHDMSRNFMICLNVGKSLNEHFKANDAKLKHNDDNVYQSVDYLGACFLKNPQN